MTSIHSIKPSVAGEISVHREWVQGGDGIGDGFTSLRPVQVGETTALYAYDKARQVAAVYVLTEGEPWVAPSGVTVSLEGQSWDSLDTFVLGNQPYLMTYERASGTFAFYPVQPDLTVGKPYTFAYLRNTPTTGFTDVAVYPSLGQLTFTGYDFETGTVANFSLAVTPASVGDAPPLLAQNLWFHHWAKGWTHFAFFRLGGANFFFKINTMKLNVNIDHMQDNPAAGSVEVGSYLQSQLPDALVITNAVCVPWQDGDPYLLTYIADTAATAVYRIHADCQGWTPLASVTTEPGATATVTYRTGNTSFVLLYTAN